jgi:hypothetical protein
LLALSPIFPFKKVPNPFKKQEAKMKTLLRIAFLAAALAAPAALAGGAAAQTSQTPLHIAASIVPKTFFKEIDLTGVQNGPGNCALMPDKCLSNVFVLRGRSEIFSVLLTVSVEHDGTVDFPGANGAARGSWQMVVTKAGQYTGTLFGDLQEGRIRWTMDMFTGARTGRSASAALRILGGLDGYGQVEPNDVSTMIFRSFTKMSDDSGYTEANIAKIF